MTLSILFVHQGYELYGSDRTLVQSVQAAASRWPEARITVLLPREGALRTVLLSIVEDVRIVELAILRRSDLRRMRLRDAGKLLRKIAEARHMMNSYDVTYINTAMVMDYILAACLVRRARIVHVHEMPTGLTTILFSALLAWSRAFLIFNSHATRCSFTVPLWQHCATVWNGCRAAPEWVSRVPRRSLNLLVIGRFNSWKGQGILLRAVARLPAEVGAVVKVRLVGGVFGSQTHFADDLMRMISELKLWDKVEVCSFTDDPWPHYMWADVVVVPSTKPEPFGLVAIEGMAAGCSVIAANHGGVCEIVVDGVTGTLVSPGSADSLAAAIVRYVEKPGRVELEGEAGRQRFAAEFEESHYKLKITDIIGRLAKLRASEVAN